MVVMMEAETEKAAAGAARAGEAARQVGERRKDVHATTLDDSLPRPRPYVRALMALPKLTIGRSSSVSRHVLSPPPRTPRCQGNSFPAPQVQKYCNSARSPPLRRPRPRARRPRARPSQGTPALPLPTGPGVIFSSTLSRPNEGHHHPQDPPRGHSGRVPRPASFTRAPPAPVDWSTLWRWLAARPRPSSSPS